MARLNFPEFLKNLCGGVSLYCADKKIVIQIGEGTEPDLRNIWRNVVRSEEALETMAQQMNDLFENYSYFQKYVTHIGKHLSIFIISGIVPFCDRSGSSKPFEFGNY